MKLLNTTLGVFADIDGRSFPLAEDWDLLINLADLAGHLRRAASGHSGSRIPAFAPSELLAGKPSPESRVIAPIGSQEVWAAGVTYLRSRTADTFTGRGDAETANAHEFRSRISDTFERLSHFPLPCRVVA
jgi:2-dehydro-3-deoxy-D-arabinonate dehydratase